MMGDQVVVRRLDPVYDPDLAGRAAAIWNAGLRRGLLRLWQQRQERRRAGGEGEGR